MYCPNCGNSSSLDQRFCRACGFALEKTIASLAEQLPTKLDETLQQQRNRLEKLGMAFLSVFGLGTLGVILYGVVVKVMVTQGRILAGLALLGLMILLASGLASVIFFAKASEVGDAKSKRGLAAPEDNELRAVTNNLLKEGEPGLPSVTERTTELLPVEKTSRNHD
jgi:hypothetical protein